MKIEYRKVNLVVSTDILVIGAGPAGLQAAIYGSRSKLRTIVIGKTKFSGLAKAHIENYCCMDGMHEGADFLESGVKQAKEFGAEILEQEALKIEKIDEKFNVYTDTDTEIVKGSDPCYRGKEKETRSKAKMNISEKASATASTVTQTSSKERR